MKSFHRYTEAEVQRVVEKVSMELRFIIPDTDIDAAFAELSLPLPVASVRMHVRKLCAIEIDKILQTFCIKFSEKFETEPRPRDLTSALAADGYSYTRSFLTALITILKERNGARWAEAIGPKKKIVMLAEGEFAMWEALQRTYGLKSDMLVPTLLRLFAVVTSSGKVSPLEIPYLTSSLTDKELKKHAQSLNFTVQRNHKSRA